MNKLTKVETLYVPINKKEFPDINDEIKLPNLVYVYQDLTKKLGYGVHRHYLQEQKNKYILSEEEIIKLISDAFIAGGNNELYPRDNKHPNEAEYIYLKLNK